MVGYRSIMSQVYKLGLLSGLCGLPGWRIILRQVENLIRIALNDGLLSRLRL